MYEDSVREYLECNGDLLVDYFKECNKFSKKPNYSEFCRVYLNGETKEGISFSSIKLKRKELTSFLRNKFELWRKLN